MSGLEELRRLNAAATTRKLDAAKFGDVIRIVWCTYYFGADQQWHNARTGHVESIETLEWERKTAGDDWGWLTESGPVPRLLAALDAVTALTDYWGTLADGDRYYARRIRAAITDALEGEA